MSGIFGSFIRDKLDNDSISAMMPWNRFYGGDGEEIYYGNNTALGCCIQELSSKHKQDYPILHDGTRHAVIDAVIYNRDELLIKCGCDYDVSDAELLFDLVVKFGCGSLAEVNGDFAGAIYDDESKCLTLLRDHIGIRPLYYYADKDTVVFSTDIRGLLAFPNASFRLDEAWIYRTVAGYDADTLDNTPYENVNCVTPACYVEISFDADSLKRKVRRYWKLGQKKIRLASIDEYCSRIRELVQDAVKRRLDATEGIVGAELSGGLDSGVVDILINRMGRKALYFSWSIDPDELEMADNDERKIIDDICKQENITCSYMHMDSDFTDKVKESMKEAGIQTTSEGSIDFRFSLPANSNTYTLLHGAFGVRESGAKVMFTGHGGDEGISHRSSSYEMFYNHEYYHYWRYLWSVTGRKHRVLRTLKRGARSIVHSARERRKEYTNWFASPELLKLDFVERYIDEKQSGMQFDYDPVAYIESGGSRNRLDNMALLGAYGGVRYMVPFLDYRVIDFAVSIPRHLYLRGGTNRYIFREAFKDILPKSLYELKNKEETSFSNLKSEPDYNWFDEYSRRKREIIDSLDREYWMKYLDFVAIDKLYISGEPSEDEYVKEMRWMKTLLKCALAQNAINSVQTINT